MTEQTPDDQAAQRLVQQVADAVERHPSVDAPREEIEQKAAEALEPLADAPLQGFVPVLAEHQVVDGLIAEHGTAEAGTSGLAGPTETDADPADGGGDARVSGDFVAEDVQTHSVDNSAVEGMADDTVDDDPAHDAAHGGPDEVPTAATDVPAAASADVSPATSVDADDRTARS